MVENMSRETSSYMGQLEAQYAVRLTDIRARGTWLIDMFASSQLDALEKLLVIHRTKKPVEEGVIFNSDDDIQRDSKVKLSLDDFCYITGEKKDPTNNHYSENPMKIEQLLDYACLTTYKTVRNAAVQVAQIVKEIVIKITGCDPKYIDQDYELGGLSICGDKKAQDVRETFCQEVKNRFGVEVEVYPKRDRVNDIISDISFAVQRKEPERECARQYLTDKGLL